MKSPILLPAIAAVTGFAIAWTLKPGETATPVSVSSSEAPPKRQGRSDPSDRPSLESSRRAKEVKIEDFPLSNSADHAPKSREEAKMRRFAEALGLSTDQQGAIAKLVEDVQAADSAGVPIIQDLTTRGQAIENGLAKLLNPAQLAKFQELRVRERENRIELRSQNILTKAIEEIDLSPAQRDEVLSRLRQKAKAELQSIPAAAMLFSDKSMLPTGGNQLPMDGILSLARIGQQPPTQESLETYHEVADQRREELEEILRCFDGILTPGQMGQYQALLSEQREILNRISNGPGR